MRDLAGHLSLHSFPNLHLTSYAGKCGKVLTSAENKRKKGSYEFKKERATKKTGKEMKTSKLDDASLIRKLGSESSVNYGDLWTCLILGFPQVL